MKKFVLILGLILSLNSCYAATTEELSKQATAFYSDNNFHKTMELILQINECERSAQDWLILGNLFDEKGEKQNAIFMYQKATFADVKYYKAYYNLGCIFASKNSWLLASNNFELAIKYNKNFASSYYNLACCQIKLKNFEQAKKNLIKAIELNPQNKDYYFNLAYCYKELHKEKQAQKILEVYNKMS